MLRQHRRVQSSSSECKFYAQNEYDQFGQKLHSVQTVYLPQLCVFYHSAVAAKVLLECLEDLLVINAFLQALHRTNL